MTDVITDMRRRLVAEAGDHNRKCLPYSAAWMTDDPASQAARDAYTGLAAAGTYATLLAAILRDVAERDPGLANEIAVNIGMAVTHGMDFLDGANDDLFIAEMARDRANHLAALRRTN